MFISHSNKVMLKNPSSQASTVREQRTSRCTSWIQKTQRNQRTNCQYPLDHGNSRKSIYFCFIDYAKQSIFSIGKGESKGIPEKTSTSALLTMLKPLTVWITTNWKILKEKGTPDHLTCLLRNLYAGQEATVRTGQGTIDWFQTGKGVHKGSIFSTCLFNLYAEYISEMPGWMNHKLKSRLSGEIPITQIFR